MKKTLKSLAKRRTVVAVVLALTVFGAVYGFAATLSVGANTLSAGNASVASCETTGTPTGTYTVAYDSTVPGYKVATVTITGLDAGCANKAISATLTPVTPAAGIAVAPGVRRSEPPPAGTVPVMVPRLALDAPVRVAEMALLAQPASRPVTVTVATL